MKKDHCNQKKYKAKVWLNNYNLLNSQDWKKAKKEILFKRCDYKTNNPLVPLIPLQLTNDTAIVSFEVPDLSFIDEFKLKRSWTVIANIKGDNIDTTFILKQEYLINKVKQQK